jgi:hypothetical protein
MKCLATVLSIYFVLSSDSRAFILPLLCANIEGKFVSLQIVTLYLPPSCGVIIIFFMTKAKLSSIRLKSKSKCKNPDHMVHEANFIKKYPSAKDRVPNTIILVNPKDWAIALENPALNTTECCQVCSIAEDLPVFRSIRRTNHYDPGVSIYSAFTSNSVGVLITSSAA